MSLQCSVASVSLTILIISLTLTASALGEPSPQSTQEKEDEKLLQEVHLPVDPSRSSEEMTNEQYFQRFVIRTREGKKFIGAYWYRQGNPREMVVDIFAIESTSATLLARRLYSGDVNSGVQALEVIDFDTDGKDDLIFITDTGGMIAKTGVLALKQTPTGFSEVFSYAGNDIWVYKERGQMRIMVKSKSANKAQEFSWNPSKKTFVVTRTVELIY